MHRGSLLSPQVSVNSGSHPTSPHHLMIPHFNKDTKACDAKHTMPKDPLANTINKASDFAKPYD